jgi:DNA mismatch repair enzyme MutH.
MDRSNYLRKTSNIGGASSSYDRTSPADIERYAKKLVGLTTRKFIPQVIIDKFEKNKSVSLKGVLGQLIEEYYFGTKANNYKGPDFEQAGVELKTTPVKKLKNGNYSSKERLVLGIIDYFKMASEKFDESDFYKKNEKLLLIFYLYKDDKNFLDFIFKLAKLWKIEGEDLRIIKDDWLKIRNKIKDGLAHEISEGDTLYLGACTKGANAESTRTQPFSGQPAKQRALSLKQGFMTDLFNRFYIAQGKKKVDYDSERVIKNIDEYEDGFTFEDLVIRRFNGYIGKTTDEIYKKLGLDINKHSKQFYSELARRMMGVNTKKIEEFEKAGVVMKTIRLKKSGKTKEDMSFPAFEYKEIVEEKWDESILKEQMEQRFFFVVYQYDDIGNLIFKKVMFWTIPISDLDFGVKNVWEKTITAIKNGKYDELPKKSENLVSHIRPHAKNKKDTFETPQGGREVKRCFWLNGGYITKVVRS